MRLGQVKEIVDKAIEHPGSRIAVVCKNSDFLRENAKQVKEHLTGRNYWRYEQRNGGRKLIFDNGSTIVFISTQKKEKGYYRGYVLLDEHS